MVQHQNFKSQLTRRTSAKKTSSASAYNCNIKFLHQALCLIGALWDGGFQAT
jgi:hypothetical protein